MIGYTTKVMSSKEIGKKFSDLNKDCCISTRFKD